MTAMLPAHRSRGAVLLTALVILLALMLGAAALMRMVESATLLSGNLAFKRAATLAAEAGAEAAIDWLAQQDAATLAQDQTANAYYAADPAQAAGSAGKPDGIDWQGKQCAGMPVARCLAPLALPKADAAGHTVQFLVQRLCADAGPHAADGGCAFHLSDEADSSSRSGLAYGRDKRLGGAPTAYYRISARASGPRNTVSIIEVLVRY